MNRKVIYLFLSAIILAIFYFGFMNYRNNTDRLVARFNSQLKEEKFEELYDESANSVHLNVSKEEFVRRMKVAVRKLKSIDDDLNFQTGKEIERKYFPEGEDNTYGFRSVEKLEKDDISLTILVFWQNKGVLPKFSDFSVIVPGEYEKKYGTPGVSYKSISNAENY